MTAMSLVQRQYDQNVINFTNESHIASRGMNDLLTSGLHQSIDTFQPNNFLTSHEGIRRSWIVGEMEAEREKDKTRARTNRV